MVSQEVGSHISIGESDAHKYYEEHKGEFVRPEQVALREIKVSTEGKKETELPDLKKKAETALKRVKDGEDFGEIAKRFSDGTTKEQGGYIGMFKRGELAKQLEEVLFKMKRNELTDVIETKQGFLVLQVLEHYDEGEQSFEKVKNEIMDRLYNEKLEPAVREYLKTLREQSYVVIKPGYAEATEYRGEAYLALNRTEDAKQAYLDLFAANRTLAGKLLEAMKQWAATPGKKKADVADMKDFIKERSEIAAQTAALTRESASQGWN